jgi:ketosteroid isomerase-like protein
MVELALALALLASPPAGVVRDLEEIEQQLATSWKNGDCATWAGLVADEWSVVHITGDVITRSQALQMCHAPQAPILTFSIDQVSVRAFGDAAVVTGRTNVTTGGASPGSVSLRFTDVFIRRGGRWRAVASHATRLVP